MRKILFAALASVIALVVVCVAMGATTRQYVQICLRSAPPCTGRLEFEPRGAVVPKRLQAHELAPVALEVGGKIFNEGGGHPPALREVMVDIDKDVAVDAVGLPACGRSQLESRDVAAARRVCREAIVGSGMAHVGFASSEAVVEAPLTLINGGTSGGETRLLIHSAIAVPDPVPLIATAKISKVQDGLRTVWRIPPILEGDGSLLDFSFKIGRRFSSQGAEHSYLAASCADGSFQVNVKEALFRNEAKTPGVAAQTSLKGSLSIPCTPVR